MKTFLINVLILACAIVLIILFFTTCMLPIQAYAGEDKHEILDTRGGKPYDPTVPSHTVYDNMPKSWFYKKDPETLLWRFQLQEEVDAKLACFDKKQKLELLVDSVRRYLNERLEEINFMLNKPTYSSGSKLYYTGEARAKLEAARAELMDVLSLIKVDEEKLGRMF